MTGRAARSIDVRGGRRGVLPGAAALAIAGILACGGGETPPAEAPAVVKRFPSPLFDGLSLGMTRDQVAKVHGIRPTITASGRNFNVWVYQRKDQSSVHLTFSGGASRDVLMRIDVHYGPSAVAADAFIARFEPRFGEPDVRRRQAIINAYGDNAHRQFETIWSDETQYVFLTERAPLEGKPGRTVYYLTARKKTLTTSGPPTGYVPPPRVDEEGNPVEEEVF